MKVNFSEKVLENRERKLIGLNNSIPWSVFPRMTEEYYFPGWIKGKYYSITANSGVSKTNFAKFIVIYNTYLEYLNTQSFDFHIKWFALEESEEDFWMSLLCLAVYVQTKGIINLFPNKALGRTKYIINDKELEYIRKAENGPFFQTLLNKIDFIHTVRNPTGLSKEIDKYFSNEEIGIKLYKEHDEQKILSGFQYNNPELYVIGVLDHLVLLSQEKSGGQMLTKHQTIGMHSQDYVLNKYCRKYNMVWVDIHQQTANNETINLYKGQIVEDTLFPSLDNLAVNKECQQQYDCVIGQYAPYRFGLEDSFGYPYRNLRDDGKSFRWAGFLKDRLAGMEGRRFPLYFTGSNPYFEELPTKQQIVENQINLGKYPLF